MSNPFVLGVLINSALYLFCCFIAGISTVNPGAWRAALFAMGLTYLSHLVQLDRQAPRWLIAALVFGSILAGAVAGTLLLF